MVDLVGEVAGPFRLRRSLAWYANDNFGIGEPTGFTGISPAGPSTWSGPRPGPGDGERAGRDRPVEDTDVVQVVENLTRLSGRLVAREPHPSRPGWDAVVVHVDEARPVAGKADLLSRHRGEDLAVAFRRELLATARGARLTFRARFTPDGPLAEPHPEEQDLVVHDTES